MSVEVELWIGTATHPRSRAWRTDDDVLHVQGIDADDYVTVYQPGEWVAAHDSDGSYLRATTPPWSVEKN